MSDRCILNRLKDTSAPDLPLQARGCGPHREHRGAWATILLLVLFLMPSIGAIEQDSEQNRASAQRRVNELEERRRNRVRMDEEFLRTLRDAEQSVRTAGFQFARDAVEVLPGDIPAVLDILSTVAEAKKAMEQGNFDRMNDLMWDATKSAIKQVAENGAVLVGAPAVVAASAGADLGMGIPALGASYGNLRSWIKARQQIQRQLERNRQEIAAIDRDLPEARGRARVRREPQETSDPPPPPSPPSGPTEEQWQELDIAIELMRQEDLQGVDGTERNRGGTAPDGTLADDEAALRAAEAEQRRESEALEAERRRNAAAKNEARDTRGRFRLSIPRPTTPSQGPAGGRGSIDGTWTSSSQTVCGTRLTSVLRISIDTEGAISGRFEFDDVVQNQDVTDCARLEERRGDRHVEPFVNPSFDGRTLRFGFRFFDQVIPLELELVDDTLVTRLPGERPSVFRRAQ